MIIVDWVDGGEVRETRFTDSLEALDVSFTAINVPEAVHDA